MLPNDGFGADRARRCLILKLDVDKATVTSFWSM